LLCLSLSGFRVPVRMWSQWITCCYQREGDEPIKLCYKPMVYMTLQLMVISAIGERFAPPMVAHPVGL
jgi:hypothetical protein